MANTSLNLVDVDFDRIKQNFKTYLKRSDSPFKDYDFDGSNMSQLLDVMAYNTYLNSYYLNMVASEMFLDTATLKDSVISHAKELNYVPRSFRSAQATVSFTVTPSISTLSTLVVPKGTTFTTKLGSNNYSFATIENTTFVKNANNVIPVTLDVYEGSFFSDSYVFDSSNTAQRFIISNYSIDTRTVSVTVLENSGANVVAYSKYSSFLGVSANTNAYFLQGTENGQYEIVFGDNILGKKPASGSTIVVNYLAGNGQLPNGARSFNIDGAISGQANISSITTVTAASGGSISESIESIKYNAPRSYQNQERAITTGDYETLLTTNFPELAGAAAFGGEEADPPVYGKVYVAVDLLTGAGASEGDKLRYYNYLKARSPLSIDPIIIDPETLNVEVETSVSYNTNVTSLKVADIKTIVETTVSNYNTTYLNGFKKAIRVNKLIENINNSHNSIIGVDVVIHPFIKFIPTTGREFSTTLNFNFELTTQFVIASDEGIVASIPAVRSTLMLKDGKDVFLMDDGNGIVNLYSVTSGGDNVIVSQAGTVDYVTGKVVINNLLISDYVPASGIHVHMYASSKSKDIASSKNQIIIVDDSDIIVTIAAVKE